LDFGRAVREICVRTDMFVLGQRNKRRNWRPTDSRPT